MSSQLKNIRTLSSGIITLLDPSYDASSGFPLVTDAVDIGGDVAWLRVDNRTDGYIKISYDGVNTSAVIGPNGSFTDDMGSNQMKTRVRLCACQDSVGGAPTTGQIYWSAKTV